MQEGGNLQLTLCPNLLRTDLGATVDGTASRDSRGVAGGRQQAYRAAAGILPHVLLQRILDATVNDHPSGRRS